ncbi:hypothetical protein Sango_3036000 [Sesamum angolense]|uniref:DUF4283 domain-containing protein n=1 Tax=Sesamum angolense TaxID=2727404 RepID=A0AAE1W1B0_9LAMI|nr:hypothetical protein Sango_3036000 [Sesamum angolense]
MRLIGSDSSYKGEPGIIYSPKETAELAARLKFALVEDFSSIWLRGEWIFDSFHMRVFKWTPDFDPQIESPIALVWIRLPALPVHLFEKNALFTLATKIGKPLRMDEPTADLSRPDLARVCIEIDVTSPKVQAVHLQIEGKTYMQQVIYENCPPYCTSCNHLGHEIANCIVTHNNEKRQVDMDSKLIANNKHADVTELNAYDILVANDVSSYPSHVPEPELPNLPQNSGTGHVAEASLEDSNYEDPLIAALLDRKLGDRQNRSKGTTNIHIEALEGKTNGGDQNSQILMAPNSTPKETPQQNTSLFRKWTRGESSKQRNREDKAREQSSPTIQTTVLESNGEEEPTPISNRFQSLEDMEMEDILQHIENMQTSKSPAVGKGVERGEDDGHFHKKKPFPDLKKEKKFNKQSFSKTPLFPISTKGTNPSKE